MSPSGRVAPVPNPRPKALRPEKPQPAQRSGPSAPSSVTSGTGGRTTKVLALAKRFETPTASASSAIDVAKTRPTVPNKTPTVPPKRSTLEGRRFPAQTARFYCRSVTRKRSSLLRRIRSTDELSASLVVGGSVGGGGGGMMVGGVQRRMSKSRSLNAFMCPEAVTPSALLTSTSTSTSVSACVTSSPSKTTSHPSSSKSSARAPEECRKNVTVVKVASMTQRPAQAPPQPPPKPSKVLLGKSRRQLRPGSPEEAGGVSEPQPSTSAHAEKEPEVSEETEKRASGGTLLRPKSSIRKPSTKPPPPPIHPKPTWQLRQSTSASNIYQSMSSPDDDNQESVWAADLKPSPPKGPPPARPPTADDDEHFDELYEDIDVGFNPAYATSSPAPNELTVQTLRVVPYSPKYQKKSQQNRHQINRQRSRDSSFYHAYEDDDSADEAMHQSVFSASFGEEKQRSSFGTWRVAGGKRRNASTHAKRPPSSGALELEKLLRIKSEIQLNISRKVDKLKLRVAHAPASLSRSSRTVSGNSVYVDPKTLQTDSGNAVAPEACLYGDDWSSDDDEGSNEGGGGEDPTYGRGGSSAAGSTIYSSGGSSGGGYGLGKSKSTSHAAQFWKSIDSALTLGRNKPRDPPPTPPNSESTTTAASVVLQSVTSSDPPSAARSSLLDEIESEYMATEFCRRQTGPVEEPPPLPTSPPPELNSPAYAPGSSSLGDEEEEEEEEDVMPSSELLEHDEIRRNHKNAEEEEENEDDMPLDAAELQQKQYTSRLPEPQPLYQIYMLHEQEKMLEAGPSSDTSSKTDEADSCCGSAEQEDALSLIRRQSSSVSTDSGRGADSSSHVTSNTSMRRERLTAASVFGSQRSLWCELPEVKSAGLLELLDENAKKLQEALFEVITSEASYLRSINVLITHFIAAPELLGAGMKPSVISAPERKHLFSNVVNVRDCSERLLCELENRLEENLILSDVCDILARHFEHCFDAYVKYCSNQVYQDRTLKRLKAHNPAFVSCVHRIEADRRCQGLDMRSFLMLPMQRITRYPLLVYAILERVPPDSELQKSAARALLLANKVVRDCNEGARRMERMEQLLDIERRLIYKSPDLKKVPLVISGRYVVKSGQVTEVYERRSKGLLQSRQKTRSLHFFLFSDLLLITKRRLNGTFVCKDYAQRRFVVVEPLEPSSHKLPPGAVYHMVPKPHLFSCVLLQNAHGKQTEYLLNVDSESDRERWLSAMRPPACSNPDEKIYAEWDCPQAVAVHDYNGVHEDELDLREGDLVNILRKMPDGWLYGERTRDGKGGWFLACYVQQVLNDHVRANNYKQRLKVIEAAAVYRAQQQAAERSGSTCSGASSGVSSGCGGGTPTAAGSSTGQSVGVGPPAVPTTPLMDRLRRLSNPRGFFVNL